MNYLVEIANQIRAAIPDTLVPEDADELFLTYAVLARSRGTETTAENVHDAWTAWMASRREHHDSMVPFADLPASVQREDEPFAEAIRRVAAKAGRDR
jgi:hypothetical protein